MSKDNAAMDMLRMEYSEICASYHRVREQELKLLTLIPIVSTIAASLFIKTSPPDHALVVSVLSFVLTFGLFLYSYHGMRHGARLVLQGSELERELGLSIGQFTGRPRPWLGGYSVAVSLIYIPVLAAWAYAAYLAR